MKEPWVAFYHEGRELASYTLRGTFPGELEATAELLAAEKNIPAEAIRVAVEERGHEHG